MIMKRIFLLATLVLVTVFAQAQMVDYKVIDGGGQGPFKSIAAQDATLPDFTIYRPAELLTSAGYDGTLPIIIFGNGGCVNTSAAHQRFLSEIASYGYVIIAIGPFQKSDDPRPMPFATTSTESYKMFQALDWICAQAQKVDSEYYGVVDTQHIAAMGQSCGGAQALYLSSDPRIKSVVMLNSGMGTTTMSNASRANVLAVHCPIVYICGGEGDMAYKNAEADFGIIKTQPVASLNLPVGHNGTYSQEFGGEFARMARAWLDYVFKGYDQGEKIFKNKDLTGYDGWTIQSKNFDGDLAPKVSREKTLADYKALRPTPDKWAKPTGRYKVVMEVDPTCPNHTIYRPADLSKFNSKKQLPVILMSGPGCDFDGDSYRPFWTEIASHGYVVVASGLPVVDGFRAAMGFTKVSSIEIAMKWIEDENARADSKYFGKLDTDNLAYMGQSCGGFIGSNFFGNERVKTMMLWNSGFTASRVNNAAPAPAARPGANAAPAAPAKIHCPVGFFTADGDMAAAMAKSSFNNTEDVPVILGICDIPGDAHGGTFREVNGGPYGQLAVKWLDWQIKGDKSAAKYFEGSKPAILNNPRWQDLQKKNIK